MERFVLGVLHSAYKRMQRLAEARGRTLSALVIDLLEEAEALGEESGSDSKQDHAAGEKGAGEKSDYG